MVVEGLLQWWQEADSLTVRQKEKGGCFCIIADGKEGAGDRAQAAAASSVREPSRHRS